MGTDVCIVCERKTEDGWVGVWADAFSPFDDATSGVERIEHRNYELFSKIRDSGRGTPEDASALARLYMQDRQLVDPTWLTLSEAVSLFNEYRGKDTEVMPQNFVGTAGDEDAHLYRVLLWLDQ